MKEILVIITFIIGLIGLILMGSCLYGGLCFVITFLKNQYRGQDETKFEDIIGIPPKKHHIIGATITISMLGAGFFYWEEFFDTSFVEVLIAFVFLIFFVWIIGSIAISKLKRR